MTRNYPKHIKRMIREQAIFAYEAEMQEALRPLSVAFDNWKTGKINGGELFDKIRNFSHGPAKDLHKRYDDRTLDVTVAHAIVHGILDRSKVPEELLQHLKRAIALCESLQKIEMPPDKGLFREDQQIKLWDEQNPNAEWLNGNEFVTGKLLHPRMTLEGDLPYLTVELDRPIQVQTLTGTYLELSLHNQNDGWERSGAVRIVLCGETSDGNDSDIGSSKKIVATGGRYEVID